MTETKSFDLGDRGIIYLGKSIDGSSCEDVCKKILELNMHANLDRIQLIVNSPGGDVNAGFAIVDMMEWSRIPVYTTGIGMVASMGLMIFMAGKKGHRAITPRCSILSHRFSWASYGSHSAMIAQRKEEDLTHRRILDHYKRYSKYKNQKDIQKHLLKDVDEWLDAEEAVRHGIADKIEQYIPIGS